MTVTSFLLTFLVILFGSREAVKFCYFFPFGSKYTIQEIFVGISTISTGVL